MSVQFQDLSTTPRAGVKGPGAAEWLKQLGLPVPDVPNTWLPLGGALGGGLIARLGNTEFLVEGPESVKLAAPISHGVYPVLRQDTALVLKGARLNDLLLETCSVNFLAINRTTRPALLTSIVGVGVTAIPDGDELRLWCDSTYGEWFLDTLRTIAAELA